MSRQVSCGVKSNTTALSGLQVIPQWNLTEAERGQSSAPLLKTLLEQLTKSESVLYAQLCETSIWKMECHPVLPFHLLLPGHQSKLVKTILGETLSPV